MLANEKIQVHGRVHLSCILFWVDLEESVFSRELTYCTLYLKLNYKYPCFIAVHKVDSYYKVLS